ncbi:MAG: aminoacyl-tRNA deacylase [Succinivibrio sp.]
MITPAQKFLKDNKIQFKEYEYECTVDHDFGKFAASKLNIEEQRVFKTILLVHEKTYVTAITPVDSMISLKNAARLLKLKSLEVAPPADATRITGYVIGGVSPFGQKRRTITLLCDSALMFDEILVSGGRRGFSVGVNPNDLVKSLNATVGDFLEHKDK